MSIERAIDEALATDDDAELGRLYRKHMASLPVPITPARLPASALPGAGGAGTSTQESL